MSSLTSSLTYTLQQKSLSLTRHVLAKSLKNVTRSIVATFTINLHASDTMVPDPGMHAGTFLHRVALHDGVLPYVPSQKQPGHILLNFICSWDPQISTASELCLKCHFPWIIFGYSCIPVTEFLSAPSSLPAFMAASRFPISAWYLSFHSSGA